MGLFSNILDKFRGHLDRFLLFKEAYEGKTRNIKEEDKPFRPTKEDARRLNEAIGQSRNANLSLLGEAYVSLHNGEEALGELVRTQDRPLFDYERRQRENYIHELNEGFAWRSEIKEENFAKHLEATLNDYDNKVWERSVLYHEGKAYRPGITEKEVKRTIAHYYNKLIHSVGFEVDKHRDLLIRARSYFPGKGGKQKVA